ncbi:similar to Saccharomyces cerevisiae YCR061W Protein of unknown function [Maudiozyma barnettii]|uniref:Protein YTP1-like C-terminal domain-containing protein n=1 Tax=Maudiozyma barnettii TaxID=61262 RepID=A0A8H2VGI3_9SACH|nr:Tvs1p [Kazachstania barnettii]CAB4254759.1 similar to Saccharomyces cerevisiae YCR061W Protein of unknown function [Kazachstania barnettii]CAD1782881.1 similar to Saccharomyces cerevisiae YCR061W Protein of unknown function [Kazachstania barnettii]
MKLRRVYLLAIAAQVAAMDMGMDMDMTEVEPVTTTAQTAHITPTPYEASHLHGLPILERPGLTPAEKMYWQNYSSETFFNTLEGNRFAFKYHVATMSLVMFISYPISLVLNSVASGWYLPWLAINLALTVSSLVLAAVFSATFPHEWYPGNIYKTTSIVLFVFIIVHFVVALLSRIASTIVIEDISEYSLLGEGIPLKMYPSGGSPGSTPEQDIETDSLRQNISPQTHFLSYKIFRSQWVQRIAWTFGGLCSLIFNTLNYPLMLYILFNNCVGLAVGNLFGKGPRVFNLLAHWIKGAVFVILGVISLARYCGLGQTRGWAWNRVTYTNPQRVNSHRLRYMPRGTLTVEFIESFLIFFYGSTNVFLEHLAGSGGAWTAKDLQHVSIAFMYIGTGLCGLLSELKLNNWRYYYTLKTSSISSNEVFAASPGYSPNPFPTMTIFWTGILMSQHAQASHTSTSVHMQWGYLLSYGSFFRIFTFLILYFKPLTDDYPSKPITEVITALCLLAGGLIFMESTDQVIEAMDYRGYTPMFTFNISVGFVALFMAWIMILCMWREWLLQCKRARL